MEAICFFSGRVRRYFPTFSPPTDAVAFADLTLAGITRKISLQRIIAMTGPQIPNRFVVGLLTGFVVLPIAVCIFLAVSPVLAALGDDFGATLFRRISLILGTLWAIDGVTLLIALAVNAVLRTSDEERSSKE